jgi:hypothetical protein
VLQPAESSWIEPLVLALYRPTVQLATLLVGDYTVAQDIVQEAFVRTLLPDGHVLVAGGFGNRAPPGRVPNFTIRTARLWWEPA